MDCCLITLPKPITKYRVAQIIGTVFVRLNFIKMLTDFHNYFTVRIRRKFVITKDPTTSQVCRYTTLRNVSVS